MTSSGRPPRPLREERLILNPSMLPSTFHAPVHATRRGALRWLGAGLMGAAAWPTGALATAASPKGALLLPPSLRLRYEIDGRVSQIPYQTDGELLWTHDNERYRALLSIDIPLLGKREQSSEGRVSAAGLSPARFVDRMRRERTVDFDQAQRQLRFSEGAPPAPLPALAQDQLSVFIQLGALLGSSPRTYPASSWIELPAMGIYGPEFWRFQVRGQEHLALPGGELDAMHIVRQNPEGEDLAGELWLAPTLGWLPARIRLSQPNGDFVDQRWRGSEAP